MQIIIPMSGLGERFKRSGYGTPKPLIEVNGKPIIAHVIDLFPGEKNFIFICNQNHLDTKEFQMQEILHKFCPTGMILGIKSHKLGPIHAVLEVEKYINKDDKTIVNYCDFSCIWDWDEFNKKIDESGCDGAIPAYKNFHPHLLGGGKYAYLKEREGDVLDIREKESFTDNPTIEYASTGTYYFASGALMLNAFKSAVTQDYSVGGEFYVSLSYKYLIAKKKKVIVYPIKYFMQWGTPEDLEDFNYWCEAFKTFGTKKNIKVSSIGTNLIPMGGLGQRFKSTEFLETKPLIPVSSNPMVIKAVDDLPQANNYCFVIREDMNGADIIMAKLKGHYTNAYLALISGLTEGQACSAAIGLAYLEKYVAEEKIIPLTISSCDNGIIFNKNIFDELLNDEKTDIIVWGVQGYPRAIKNPTAYGWI